MKITKNILQGDYILILLFLFSITLLLTAINGKNLSDRVKSLEIELTQTEKQQTTEISGLSIRLDAIEYDLSQK